MKIQIAKLFVATTCLSILLGSLQLTFGQDYRSSVVGTDFDYITDEDILTAAELALPHRVKAQPFQEGSVNAYDLEESLEQARSEFGESEPGDQAEQQEADANPVKKKRH